MLTLFPFICVLTKEHSIKWHPVVLNLSSLTSKQKARPDPLATYRERVESLDIKLGLEYIVNKTTHVISNKRNSARNLQALINGQWVVTEAFIEAIVHATSSPSNTDASETALPSPLEDDFDANWPNALDYVPVPGKEPVHRPAELFAPDPDRQNLFAGHTVVFFESAQLESLQDPINDGTGKAVLYNVSQSAASIDNLVNFVHDVAPQKPIVVRFRGGQEEQWKIDFQQASQVALSQRSVDQNEFLDAILTSDISVLKRPIEEEPDSSLPSQRQLPGPYCNCIVKTPLTTF